MFKSKQRTPEQIEAAAAAASAKAVAGGMRQPKTAKVSVGSFRTIKLDGDQIVLRGQRYPVKGTRAEVSDFRSGLVGRKHTTDITVTLAGGQQIGWSQTDAGTMARVTHRQAVKFAAAVNTAATGRS